MSLVVAHPLAASVRAPLEHYPALRPLVTELALLFDVLTHNSTAVDVAFNTSVLLAILSRLVGIIPLVLTLAALSCSARASWRAVVVRAMAKWTRILWLTLLGQLLLVVWVAAAGWQGQLLLSDPTPSSALVVGWSGALVAWTATGLLIGLPLLDLVRTAVAAGSRMNPPHLGREFRRAVESLVRHPVRLLSAYLMYNALGWLCALGGLAFVVRCALHEASTATAIGGWAVQQLGVTALLCCRVAWFARCAQALEQTSRSGA